MNQVFLLRVPEFVEDLRAIHHDWPFDLIVHDAAFLGGLFVKDQLCIKTVAIGVMPLGESDDHVPAAGMGKQPATTLAGRWIQHLMRHGIQVVMFKPCTDLYNELRLQYGMAPNTEFVIDAFVRTPDLYLQSGIPGFEYRRKRISPNVRFVGPLIPYSAAKKSAI